jgi:transposase
MRAMGVSYLVGTPKGRLTKLETDLLTQPWAIVREGVQVKQLPREGERYILAMSEKRVHKERAMRRKRLKRYLAALQKLQARPPKRDQLLMRLAVAKKAAGRAAGLITLTLPKATEVVTDQTFHFALDRNKLRKQRRREGRYLLRTNLTDADPVKLWTFYVQLTEVEQAFKELKHDLAIRPLYHQLEHRIEAHIFVAFLAYCLQVTLKHQLRQRAPGLTPRAVLEQFKTIQMVDVEIPTTDGRRLTLSRYTQPEAEHRVLLECLKLTLPAQPPPKITAKQLADAGVDQHAA